jgi:hypothetical protein
MIRPVVLYKTELRYPIESVISREDPGWEPGSCVRKMRCPVCHFDCIHEGAPYVVPGHDNYEAGWDGRGDLVVVPMEGECGSRFDLCFGFHKGQLMSFVRLTLRCEED